MEAVAPPIRRRTTVPPGAVAPDGLALEPASWPVGRPKRVVGLVVGQPLEAARDARVAVRDKVAAKRTADPVGLRSSAPTARARRVDGGTRPRLIRTGAVRKLRPPPGAGPSRAAVASKK